MEGDARASGEFRVDGGTGGEQRAGSVAPQAGRGQVQGNIAPVEHVRQLRDEQVLVHAPCGRARRSGLDRGDPGRVVRQYCL
jgi:hypothetical protein